MNIFSTLHYHELKNLPTRITQKSNYLLDNISTTLQNPNSSKGVLISDHSDHYIVFTIQHGTPSTKAPTHREMRDFCEQNISKFMKKIKNTTWDKILLKMHTVYFQIILINISKSVSQIKALKLIAE